MSFLEAPNLELSKRTSNARLAAGFSLKDAANLLGFNNYQTLSEIEKGSRKLNATELCAMAKLYNRRLDYFFEENLHKDPIPLWRKNIALPAEKIQNKFQSFLENYSTLENLLERKKRWKEIQKGFDKSDFSQDGYSLAGQLGKKTGESLNLGSRPAYNLLNVLENNLRFKILHLELDDGISGACVVDERLGVGVLINATEAPWRRNFDLAHELFHVVTWGVFTHEEVGDGNIKTQPEKYADAFASSLLLPEGSLKEAISEIVTGGDMRLVDVIELAKEFGVSTEAILWRLVNLGFTKKEAVEELLRDSMFRKTDRQLRRGLYYTNQPDKFPERYISLAFRCLMEGKISRGTFADYLEIDRSEIDDFLSQAGFMEEYYDKIAST